MTLEIVELTVKFCGARCPPDAHPDLRAHWRKWRLPPVERALAVEDDGRTVALFRFFTGRWLTACGTWVDPEYRGLGLGMLLWRAAIAMHRPRRVDVNTTSDGGRGLVAAIRRDFPSVQVREGSGRGG